MAHAAPFRRIENRSSVSSAGAAALVKQHLGAVMYEVASDPIQLLEVVGHGPVVWRNRLVKAFSPFPVDEHLANSLFHFFCLRVVSTYGQPGMDIEDAFDLATKALDSVEQRTPPTQAEIDAAWELDDASSDEANRYFYDGVHPLSDFERRIH